MALWLRELIAWLPALIWWPRTIATPVSGDQNPLFWVPHMVHKHARGQNIHTQKIEIVFFKSLPMQYFYTYWLKSRIQNLKQIILAEKKKQIEKDSAVSHIFKFTRINIISLYDMYLSLTQLRMKGNYESWLTFWACMYIWSLCGLCGCLS